MSRNIMAVGAVLSLSVTISSIAFSRSTSTLYELPQETASQHIREAREALRKENYGQAKAEAKKAISIDKKLHKRRSFLND
jgi:Tfp pilus assembly protein PilF